jgi:hypothetical protein
MSKHDFKKDGIPFTQVANTVINDPNLSAKSKGIYVYLFSKPDGWDFALDRITLSFTDGRKGLYAGIKELEDFGYLIRKKQPTGRTSYLLKTKSSLLPPRDSRIPEPVAPEGNLPFGLRAQKGNISNKDIIVIKNISNKDTPPVKKPKKSLAQNKNTGIAYLRAVPKSDIALFAQNYACSETFVLDMAKSVILYCESKGKTYKNYRSALQKWLHEEMKRIKGYQARLALQEPETLEI